MMRFGLVAVALAGCASAGKSGASSDAPPVVTPDAHEFFDGNIEVIPDAPPDARIVMTDAASPDAACVPVATELLANPAFDLTPVGTGWQQTPIDPTYPPITSDGFNAQSPPYKDWMGGFAGTDIGAASATDQIYQDVTVPAGTTQLVLSGYYVVGTNENPNDAPYDTASVDLLQTNGTPIENVLSLSNLTITGSTYAQFSYTFTSNVAGQTVRLRFTSTNDITNATNFFFDTLSLQATHCP